MPTDIHNFANCIMYVECVPFTHILQLCGNLGGIVSLGTESHFLAISSS